MLILQAILGVALIIVVTVLAMLFSGFDRVLNARMQRRVGPPVLQPVYDFLKLLGKENIVSRRSVSWLFNAAPWASLTASLMAFLYIPMGTLPSALSGHGDIILVLYLLTTSSVCLCMGAFSSGSPIANVGAQRELVLMMSYEVPMAMTVSTVAWLGYRLGMGPAFSLSTYTHMSIWGSVGWLGFGGLACLFVAMLAVIPAESGTGLMDIAEDKTEILEGIAVEYSGVNLALFNLSMSIRSLAISALVVSLFFPFSLGRFLSLPGVLGSVVDFFWFWVKVFIVGIFGVTYLRTAFGRLKIQQASGFYWREVGILSLAGLILVSAEVLTR